MALKNRFPTKVINFWIGWTFDLSELGHRTSNALHHIISPGSNRYKEGEFNESIFNSCPIDNFKNHIGQAMHYKEKEDLLLERVITVLIDHDYVPDKNDLIFLKTYGLNNTYTRIKKESSN
jgi:hypothetical protein